MLVPLNLFHDIIFEEMIEEILSSHCRTCGIELMEVLGIEDADEFQSAVAAAKRACATLNITTRYHFKPIFLYDGLTVRSDHKLSQLACYLVTINADPVIRQSHRHRSVCFERSLQRKKSEETRSFTA